MHSARWQHDTLHNYFRTEAYKLDVEQNVDMTMKFGHPKVYCSIRDALEHLQDFFHGPRRYKRILLKWFEGNVDAMRVGFAFAKRRVKYLHLAWNLLVPNRFEAYTEMVQTGVLTATANTEPSDEDFVDSITFGRKLSSIFKSELGGEAKRILVNLTALFMDANHSKFSNKPGAGTLSLMEVTLFIRNFMGFRFAACVDTTTLAGRTASIFSQWIIDGSFEIKFHELCTVIFTDPHFDILVSDDTRTELLQLFSEEEPQVVSGKIRPGRKKGT